MLAKTIIAKHVSKNTVDDFDAIAILTNRSIFANPNYIFSLISFY